MRELTAADRSSTTAAGCADQAWVLNPWAARRSNIARSVSCVARSPLEDNWFMKNWFLPALISDGSCVLNKGARSIVLAKFSLVRL